MAIEMMTRVTPTTENHFSYKCDVGMMTFEQIADGPDSQVGKDIMRIVLFISVVRFSTFRACSASQKAALRGLAPWWMD